MAAEFNPYETRSLVGAVNNVQVPSSFLASTFFPNNMTLDSGVADIDIVKGNEKLAPFVAPMQEGLTVKREGFSTVTIRLPSIKIKRPIVPYYDLLLRGAGETVYQSGGPMQRAADLLMNDLAEMRAMIDRRIEWMCAQALFYGGIATEPEKDHKGMHIDFKRSASNNVILVNKGIPEKDSDAWFRWLRFLKRTVARNSGQTADVAIFGSKLIDIFLNNQVVMKRLDIQRLNVGTLQPAQQSPGVTYWGRLLDPGLDIYTYDVTYTGHHGRVMEMVPDDMIFVGASGLGRMLYGAVLDMDAYASNTGVTTYAGQYFAKSWVDHDPSAQWVMVQANPLPVPYMTDAYAAAHVTIG
jgi:hypothetical protein